MKRYVSDVLDLPAEDDAADAATPPAVAVVVLLSGRGSRNMSPVTASPLPSTRTFGFGRPDPSAVSDCQMWRNKRAVPSPKPMARWAPDGGKASVETGDGRAEGRSGTERRRRGAGGGVADSVEGGREKMRSEG